jgi:hypothetical protein
MSRNIIFVLFTSFFIFLFAVLTLIDLISVVFKKCPLAVGRIAQNPTPAVPTLDADNKWPVLLHTYNWYFILWCLEVLPSFKTGRNPATHYEIIPFTYPLDAAFGNVVYEAGKRSRISGMDSGNPTS